MKDWMREYWIAEVLFPKPFNLCNAGLYDYKMVKNLPWEKYREFVLFFQSLREGQYRDLKSEIEANLEVDMITGDRQ